MNQNIRLKHETKHEMTIKRDSIAMGSRAEKRQRKDEGL